MVAMLVQAARVFLISGRSCADKVEEGNERAGVGRNGLQVHRLAGLHAVSAAPSNAPGAPQLSLFQTPARADQTDATGCYLIGAPVPVPSRASPSMPGPFASRLPRNNCHDSVCFGFQWSSLDICPVH